MAEPQFSVSQKQSERSVLRGNQNSSSAGHCCAGGIESAVASELTSGANELKPSFSGPNSPVLGVSTVTAASATPAGMGIVIPPNSVSQSTEN